MTKLCVFFLAMKYHYLEQKQIKVLFILCLLIVLCLLLFRKKNMSVLCIYIHHFFFLFSVLNSQFLSYATSITDLPSIILHAVSVTYCVKNVNLRWFSSDEFHINHYYMTKYCMTFL
jgi:hypothetical protein